MASTQRVDENESCEPNSNNSSKSCFQPTVCLKDWWLIRAESDSQGRTLAVAGLTSREGQALRVFSSAPILKTYDVFYLETIDGICVVLKGFINKSRSEENGFPSEVFEQFLFGFPPQWEAFNEKRFGRESKGKAAASDALGSEKTSVCPENFKDHVEATGEKIQDDNGRKDCEVEDNLKRDNQNDGEVASEVIVQKTTKRATRSSNKLKFTNTSTSIAEEQTADDNRTTQFKCARASAKNAKRKLTYGSPQQGKEEVPLISPEPSSFNRSRSGRVLLHPMAFWRNQMAIYDADRMVTAIKQSDEDLVNLRRVSRSEPSRKRRQYR
ncbi:hypothetical protein K7X08_015844 [Anisodus acutangulus]|uniref:SANTA domain-containing protein n=1 Tax=Anisodus acutangulus TaxID=402998 RepID=A0A9Q1QYM2_9SOLA|nr:hypothetical protein K7X08_015844 [Anisodus acutangulus]